ncbi:phosphate-selective porin OprO and OprP [Pseudoxanthomonas sp. CF385]|uniref:OprO/OprP family phosphate-selective porin n=1 Tax=Pseudoxanthomonas sp. CF385 TaxID=1881042 RepID=UPI00088E9B6D|nr:porin [Pseudoxanthomonas sp. CF385]SDQ89884.1 phosphate-selective porin OprO and OprP [Pseudoxanthomonas sp. CF385]
MRYSLLAAALAVAMGSTSFSASAADSRDQTIAELKAQLEALSAKVAELEERSDAQSDVNIDTASQLDKLNTGSPKVDTKGGLKITSADGKFEASVGGRIQFDTYAFDRDLASTTGTTEFRRARLTLQGKAYGWEYKMENDFGAGGGLDGFRDVYIAKSALGGKFTIGHFKPYRAMEELTSSNELLTMERPFASATGLFNGRQFQQGVGYLRAGENYTAGLSVFNLRGAAGTRNEGVGAAGRVTFAPINTDNSTLHFGAWYSFEDNNLGSADLVATSNYAGRRGPSQVIATTTGASRNTVDVMAVEAAGSFGPAFFQAEYADATYGQPLGRDQDVKTYYAQGSFMLNGGHKPYKGATGVFGSPKVADKGLWELTGRYDYVENETLNREVTSWILGVNYYVNPNLRFMFNFTQGDNEVTGDETAQYALRTQFAW